MRTAAVTTVLVLGLGVGAAGCSADEAEPSALPPVASASASAEPIEGGVDPSVSASSGPSAPTSSPVAVSDSASAGTSQGASAFAEHYMSVLQDALATGTPFELERLSDRGCGGCRNLIQAVVTARADGHHVEGGAFVVQFAEAPPVQGGEVIVDLRYLRQAGELVDAEGALVEHIAPEGPVDAQMRLRRQTNDWLVLGFRLVPQ